MTKRYTGTKAVTAAPMTRAEYNDYRGWDLPTDEDGADEGYLVEYLDGGKPNDSRHAGYISWSPKEQFDKAYRERPSVQGLQEYQQRVVDERNDLEEKLAGLEHFIATHGETVSAHELMRLNAQSHHMGHYLETLNERIGAFLGKFS